MLDNMVLIEKFVWSILIHQSPLISTDLHSITRPGNKLSCLSGCTKIRPFSWNMVATSSCWGLRSCLGYIPTDMSSFESEIHSKGGNVYWRDKIFKASVNLIFIHTKSSFGESNKNRNKFIAIDMAIISLEALHG